MIRTFAIAALLLTTTIAFGGSTDTAPAVFALTEDASAAPDFCETYKKVRNTATGEPDDSCPHGPTP